MSRSWKNDERYCYHFSFSSCNECKKKTLVLLSKQRLHKLCILQKLGYQKLCWDQANLSSLVNKQVGAEVARVGASEDTEVGT